MLVRRAFDMLMSWLLTPFRAVSPDEGATPFDTVALVNHKPNSYLHTLVSYILYFIFCIVLYLLVVGVSECMGDSVVDSPSSCGLIERGRAWPNTTFHSPGSFVKEEVEKTHTYIGVSWHFQFERECTGYVTQVQKLTISSLSDMVTLSAFQLVNSYMGYTPIP